MISWNLNNHSVLFLDISNTLSRMVCNLAKAIGICEENYCDKMQQS